MTDTEVVPGKDDRPGEDLPLLGEQLATSCWLVRRSRARNYSARMGCCRS
jgi:hypothetical protein